MKIISEKTKEALDRFLLTAWGDGIEIEGINFKEPIFPSLETQKEAELNFPTKSHHISNYSSSFANIKFNYKNEN